MWVPISGQAQDLPLRNILEIMISHAHGDDTGHLVQASNNINLFLYGICLYNRHDLTVREHAMNLYPGKGGNLPGNSFDLTVVARYNNT